ncbi:MAG: endonuclease/exonuclease/phosphatase family protein [Bacteroidales bacterium]|nr:endonuclease/exonuclease/phosphatase family protein [Bacteroidales bacterium]
MSIRGKSCIAAALAVLLAGCDKPTAGGGSSGPPEPQNVTITLMTYNVGTFNKYRDELGHFSYPEVAEVIGTVGPVVVGLNETDYGAARTLGEFQASRLASTLGQGWSSRFFYADKTWYGNAVVWDRYSLGSGKSFDRISLDKTDGSEVRSMGAVEFRNFIFCSTHLDHISETDRLSAVDKITAWAEAHYSGKPIFLAGDMNATPGSAPITRLSQNWIRLTGNNPTFPSDGPTRCIDYIFIYKADASGEMPPGVELLGSGVVTADTVPAVATASDHCPVWASLLLSR